MVTDVLPLRAIVLQCLLLTVAVAIESAVLFRRLPTPDDPISPKQSIQYALSINLLSTALGWFTVFSFFQLETSLPPNWIGGLEVTLLDFIFFNKLSGESLSLLIVVGFLTFFASFVIKQVGLWGLRWLLQLDLSQVEEPESKNNPALTTGIRNALINNWTLRADDFRRVIGSVSSSEKEKGPIIGIRNLRTEPRDDNVFNTNISAVLIANAWSYSAILIILLLLDVSGTRSLLLNP